jgi:hypothetical protein
MFDDLSLPTVSPLAIPSENHRTGLMEPSTYFPKQCTSLDEINLTPKQNDSDQTCLITREDLEARGP